MARIFDIKKIPLDDLEIGKGQLPRGGRKAHELDVRAKL